jgi:hypothetical protein
MGAPAALLLMCGKKTRSAIAMETPKNHVRSDDAHTEQLIPCRGRTRSHALFSLHFFRYFIEFGLLFFILFLMRVIYQWATKFFNIFYLFSKRDSMLFAFSPIVPDADPVRTDALIQSRPIQLQSPFFLVPQRAHPDADDKKKKEKMKERMANESGTLFWIRGRATPVIIRQTQ